MPMTYTAVVRDGRLEWEGEAPTLPPGARLRVEVVEPPPAPPRGPAMAAVMEAFAAAGGPTSFPHDLVEWQREMRKDRPLPGRDYE